MEPTKPKGITIMVVMELVVRIQWPTEEDGHGSVFVNGRETSMMFDRVHPMDANPEEYTPGWWQFEGKYFIADDKLCDNIVLRVKERMREGRLRFV